MLIHIPKPQLRPVGTKLYFHSLFSILSEIIPSCILEWEERENLRIYCKKIHFVQTFNIYEE